MRLSISPCHAVRNSVAPWCRGDDAKWLSFKWWKKPPTGLISGGTTPIWCPANQRGAAQFKRFWSDDTKNNYREERRGGQAWPGTAGGVRPRRRAAGGDEAILGAR